MASSKESRQRLAAVNLKIELLNDQIKKKKKGTWKKTRSVSLLDAQRLNQTKRKNSLSNTIFDELKLLKFIF